MIVLSAGFELIKLIFSVEDVARIGFHIRSTIEVPSTYSFWGGDQFDGVNKVVLNPESFVSSDYGYRIFSYFDFLVTMGVVLLVLKKFKDLFTSLDEKKRNENYFIEDNYYRIRMIGFLTLLMAVYQFIKSLCFSLFFLEKLDVMGKAVSFWPEFERLDGVFSGLIILVIAEVYKAGLDLKKETELTI